MPALQTELSRTKQNWNVYYCDIKMGAMASQITSLTIVYSTVYPGADQRKHQSSASLAFVRGIHRWPVNSPHKGPVTWKMLPFDDVIVDSPSLLRSKHSAHLTPVLDFGHSWLWWYKYSLFNFSCILAQDSDFESRRHKLSFYSDQGTFSVTWSKLRLYSANHRAGY